MLVIWWGEYTVRMQDSWLGLPIAIALIWPSRLTGRWTTIIYLSNSHHQVYYLRQWTYYRSHLCTHARKVFPKCILYPSFQQFGLNTYHYRSDSKTRSGLIGGLCVLLGIIGSTSLIRSVRWLLARYVCRPWIDSDSWQAAGSVQYLDCVSIQPTAGALRVPLQQFKGDNYETYFNELITKCNFSLSDSHKIII